MFYKQQKDTDRNVLSGNEDDLWDEPDSVVAEVKASKKPNMKVSESDFENDTAQGQAERKMPTSPEQFPLVSLYVLLWIGIPP